MIERLPETLLPLVEGGKWHRDVIGESGGEVWGLHVDGRPVAFLKAGSGPVAQDIVDEFARLEWLAPNGLVPRVLGFVRRGSEAWLLTEALPGQMAEELLETQPENAVAVVRALARFCRRLHALPMNDCPFSAVAPRRLAQARRNIDEGLVDGDDFDDVREGWTGEQVWSELMKLDGSPMERVVTHGDLSTGNLFIKDGEVVGCIDVGRAGLADPYQDLAILWNNLADYGPDLQQELWRSYGIEKVDRRRLDFHLLLDELF